jgi:hypothetical protein
MRRIIISSLPHWWSKSSDLDQTVISKSLVIIFHYHPDLDSLSVVLLVFQQQMNPMSDVGRFLQLKYA